MLTPYSPYYNRHRLSNTLRGGIPSQSSRRLCRGAALYQTRSICPWSGSQARGAITRFSKTPPPPSVHPRTSILENLSQDTASIVDLMPFPIPVLALPSSPRHGRELIIPLRSPLRTKTLLLIRFKRLVYSLFRRPLFMHAAAIGRPLLTVRVSASSISSAGFSSLALLTHA